MEQVEELGGKIRRVGAILEEHRWGEDEIKDILTVWSPEDIGDSVGARVRRFIRSLNRRIQPKVTELTSTTGDSFANYWKEQNVVLQKALPGVQDARKRKVMRLTIELNSIGIEHVASTKVVGDKFKRAQSFLERCVKHPTAQNLNDYLLSNYEFYVSIYDDTSVTERKYQKEKELKAAFLEQEIITRKDLEGLIEAVVADILASMNRGEVSLTATEVKIILELPKMLEPILINIALANPTLPALAKMNVWYMHDYERRLDRLLEKLTQLSEARTR